MRTGDEMGHSSITELLPLDTSDKLLSRSGENIEPLDNDDSCQTRVDPMVQAGTRPKYWSNWPRYTSNPVYCSVPIIISAIPLVLLLVFSARLSHSLALNGCLPDGNFALPFTSTVWDPAQFFATTIPFTGRYLPGECFNAVGSGSGADGTPELFYDLPCAGYTFAQVKVIDLAWDVLVGRGGQAALAAIAYRLFSHTFTKLMREGEVGYDVFATTKFQCGSFGSLYTLTKHALGRVPLPVTSRAKWLYLAMAVSTAYILAVPTIISATTGYTSVFDPSVLAYPTIFDESGSTRGLYDCGGKLLPAWGNVTNRFVHDPPGSGSQGDIIAYPGMPIDADDNDLSFSYDWKDYYDRYNNILESCNGRNVSSCKEAQVSSWVLQPPNKDVSSSNNLTLPAPLVAITKWADEAPKYSHWNCNGKIISTSGFKVFDSDVPNSGLYDGVCRSGSRFAWGFSFLVTLVAAILNFAFAIVMCCIWYSTREGPAKRLGRQGAEIREYNIVLDAIAMSAQAQEHYGSEISKWNARSVKNRIFKGHKGMTIVD